MKKSTISPQNLKVLRERKGWSQEKLASKSSLTARRISSLEKEDANQISVQQKTFKGLCKALDVRPEVLSGEAQLPSLSKPHEVLMHIHPQTRLNLDLLNKRYGLTIDDVINVAPLLLAKEADSALSRQEQELKKDIELYQHETYEKPLGAGLDMSVKFRLEEFGGIPHETVVEEYFEAREAAISKRDIFETEAMAFYEEEWDCPNPFANYLNEECVKHRISEIHTNPNSTFSYFPSYRIPQYSICSDELELITCGSNEARWALMQGMATIAEIPDDLWEPRNSGKRVVWLEEKYHQAETARLAENSIDEIKLEEF